MKEFTKSLFSYSLAISFLGLKQIDNAFRSRQKGEHKSPAAKSFDSVTAATKEQFGETLTSTFQAMDNLQRGIIELTFSVLWPFGSSTRGRRDSSTEEASTTTTSEPRRWTEVMNEPDIARARHTDAQPPLGGRLQ